MIVVELRAGRERVVETAEAAAEAILAAWGPGAGQRWSAETLAEHEEMISLLDFC